MHLPLQPLRTSQGGATAIEYAMVAFFVSIAAFAVLVRIGTSVSDIFTTVSNSF